MSEYYVTCTQGHKLWVIWSDDLQRFAFTCDECEIHFLRAVSAHGLIEVRIISQLHEAA